MPTSTTRTGQGRKKQSVMRIQLPFVSLTMGQLIVDALDHLYGNVDECFEEADRESARKDLVTLHDALAYQLNLAQQGVRATLKAIDSPTDLSPAALPKEGPLPGHGADGYDRP